MLQMRCIFLVEKIAVRDLNRILGFVFKEEIVFYPKIFAVRIHINIEFLNNSGED